MVGSRHVGSINSTSIYRGWLLWHLVCMYKVNRYGWWLPCLTPIVSGTITIYIVHSIVSDLTLRPVKCFELLSLDEKNMLKIYLLLSGV